MANLYAIPYSDLQELGKCGSGTFSQVYRAFWKAGNRIVALKKFLRLQVSEEAEVLSQLSHRNIVKFIGLVQDDRVFGIVTEYIENGSLYDFLHGISEATRNADGDQHVSSHRDAANHVSTNGGGGNEHSVSKPKIDLDFRTLVSMASDIACGMNYLHSEAPTKVVHNDLKSKNVLITSDRRCKICDFGSAQLGAATSRASLVGTYAWMSPEVLRGESVDERCDVWSFGVVVWELTTREVPFAQLRKEQIFWNVAYHNQHLPVSLSCPAELASLMNVCWNPQATRPSFAVIQRQLATMANDAKLVASANTFMADHEAFVRESELFRQRLLEFERTLQGRRQELTQLAERLRARENELEQQFKVPKLEEYDVRMWRDIDVFEWVKHLHIDSTQSLGGGLTVDQLSSYANSFLNNNITGEQLLSISHADLMRLGIRSYGHQKSLMERITLLDRDNRMHVHFPTLASTVLQMSSAGQLAARGGRQSPLTNRQFIRLTFVFGMHVVACCDGHNSNTSKRPSKSSVSGDDDEDEDGSESQEPTPTGYKYKMFADVLEDERDPSVAAPMFLIRQIQFRYDPPTKRNGAAAGVGSQQSQSATGWSRVVNRPPYITPEWFDLPAAHAESLTQAAARGSPGNASFRGGVSPAGQEILLPEEHVSIRIEFVPKHVRQPAKVEHRHAFSFTPAHVRCTSHDLEAAARERERERAALSKQKRRKTSAQVQSTANTGATPTLRTSISVPEVPNVAKPRPFNAQSKLVKNLFVSNYSQLAVTLELQPAARNASVDIGEHLQREQDRQAEEESASCRSSRTSPPELSLDTVCTTTGTVFSVASPASTVGTRTNTPLNTNPISVSTPGPGQNQAIEGGYSAANGIVEALPFENKMTYARAAANQPVARSMSRQVSTSSISNSRSNSNLASGQKTTQRLTGTYQPANHNGHVNAKQALNTVSSSKSGTWLSKTSNTSVSPLVSAGDYQAAQSIASTARSPVGAPVVRSGYPQTRDRAATSSALLHPPTNTGLQRPVSVAPGISTDRNQMTETMLQLGRYRSTLSDGPALNSPVDLTGTSLRSGRTLESRSFAAASIQTDIEDSIITEKAAVTDACTQTISYQLVQAAASQSQSQPQAQSKTAESSGESARSSRSAQPPIPLEFTYTDASSAPRAQREHTVRRRRARERQDEQERNGQLVLQPSTTSESSHVTDATAGQLTSEAIKQVDTRSSLGKSWFRSTEGLESVASTVSVDAAGDSSQCNSNARSRDSLAVDNDDRRPTAVYELAVRSSTIASERGIDSSRYRQYSESRGDSNTFPRFAQLPLTDRSQSDLSALQMAPKGRRRRFKKLGFPPFQSNSLTNNNNSSSNNNEGSAAGPAVGTGATASAAEPRASGEAADWHTVVSRRTRPRPPVLPSFHHFQGLRERELPGSNAAAEGLISKLSVFAQAAQADVLGSDSDVPSEDNLARTSSTSQPNLHRAHLNNSSGDGNRTMSTHSQARPQNRKVTPSTPVSPNPTCLPPGLQGANGPFANNQRARRQRHSSQSERESTGGPVTHAHAELDRDQQAPEQLTGRSNWWSRR